MHGNKSQLTKTRKVEICFQRDYSAAQQMPKPPPPDLLNEQIKVIFVLATIMSLFILVTIFIINKIPILNINLNGFSSINKIILDFGKVKKKIKSM